MRVSLPYGVDVTVPSVARMYDSLLGGKDNYPADRAACTELLKQVPSMRELALNNRQFLRRVVHVLAAKYGIRQFIDHGSGLPTQDNVHEIAQRVDAASRVVYIDNDPIVRTIGGILLESNENTAVLQADIRDTDAIFSSEPVEQLIDLNEPVAALFVSVLHCIPDASGPADLIAQVAGRLPAGSMMVVCQLVSDSAQVRNFVTGFMDEQTQGHWGRVREKRDVAAFCAPLDLIEPGLVEVSAWRAEKDDVPAQLSWEWEEYGGVGFVRP
ncbi:SAM-dependent methyltransferase [Streptomyces sp. NBC_00201]|uniref:SAM-dependent methyltransferase n=1 Tax=unclassified Streptomyces TaxID=2593676 RepID=UPI00224E7DA3|nr:MULTISPECIES: SAM-dependent methyltransferase [unclassified Streptomyces]MCX5063754.1 SAM-dependent methyltransferase [Streptomyces sp. NBC_00452]MCX5251909.1 SAM-dependent methyltransferase [Streptomyces sp. NBC_00201]MCX5294188.1 SAM-dependent methyltransferase [Streptomyces sp. NBC_00183]